MFWWVFAIHPMKKSFFFRVCFKFFCNVTTSPDDREGFRVALFDGKYWKHWKFRKRILLEELELQVESSRYHTYEFIQSIGYKKSEKNMCLYLTNEDKVHLIPLADDMMIGGNNRRSYEN